MVCPGYISCLQFLHQAIHLCSFLYSFFKGVILLTTQSRLVIKSLCCVWQGYQSFCSSRKEVFSVPLYIMDINWLSHFQWSKIWIFVFVVFHFQDFSSTIHQIKWAVIAVSFLFWLASSSLLLQLGVPSHSSQSHLII